MKFTGNITRESNSNWKCVVWEDSVNELGTGKPVKVKTMIDKHEFLDTFLPVGGMHMLPLRASVLTKIKKDLGDLINVDIELI